MTHIYIKKFITQKKYEKIIFFLRRDVIVFVKEIVLFIFLLLLPFLGYLFLQVSFPTLLENTVVKPFLIILTSVYFLTVWLTFFIAFIDYYLDFWIITNDRLINVEQHLFSRVISELDLYKIQDVTAEIKGLLPTMFNYGNIHVQTAGAIERFILEEVPNPHEISKKIMELAEEDRKYHLKEAPVTNSGAI